MHYKPHSQIYKCDMCSGKQKRIRGCKRNRRQAVLKIKCVCEGDKKCDLCKGKGEFAVKRCPRTALFDAEVYRFLGYFWHWKETDCAEYPDGRGRLYQPSKMLEAFQLCGSISAKREQAEAEAARKHLGHGRQ